LMDDDHDEKEDALWLEDWDALHSFDVEAYRAKLRGENDEAPR
jgi:hypothetical protein